jgi:hypothetical protein
MIVVMIAILSESKYYYSTMFMVIPLQ